MSCDVPEREDVFVLSAELICQRLTRVALDMNVALGHTDGLARTRLEQAIGGIDRTIREVRLLAARPGVGRWGSDRRPG